MIGVDTNVLLRFVLDDDPVQSALAAAFLMDDGRLGDPAVIGPVALLEFVWTLRRREGFTKAYLLEILDALGSSGRIVYSDEALVRSCIERWRSRPADLPDYLIAAMNLQAGARTTVTFDREAGSQSGFVLLPS